MANYTDQSQARKSVLKRGNAKSTKSTYTKESRMREIEVRMVQLENKIRAIEDRIRKVALVTSNRFGKQVIVTTKK